MAAKERKQMADENGMKPDEGTTKLRGQAKETKRHMGYPRDAPATVLFGEWFRFEKSSDQYPHNDALTTYFRTPMEDSKAEIDDLEMIKYANLHKEHWKMSKGSSPPPLSPTSEFTETFNTS
ncbi:hypothetical protein LXL04_014955 [Taraxacum kok-saghyz]